MYIRMYAMCVVKDVCVVGGIRDRHARVPMFAGGSEASVWVSNEAS